MFSDRIRHFLRHRDAELLLILFDDSIKMQLQSAVSQFVGLLCYFWREVTHKLPYKNYHTQTCHLPHSAILFFTTCFGPHRHVSREQRGQKNKSNHQHTHLHHG
jgi:hypothetical protein